MEIGIIGAGSVGATLGQAFATRGHQVAFGVRHPDAPKYRELRHTLDGSVRIGTVADAVAGAELVVLATPWTETRAAIEAAGGLAGKSVLDATNPLLPNLAGLDWPGGRSGAQQIAAWAPRARVVKAFNTVGFNITADPALTGGAASLLVAGDDPTGKAQALALAAELGFDPVDAGPLAAAGLLENLALLWISLAYQQGLGREFAFALLKR